MELYEYQAKMLLQRYGVPVCPHYLIERGQNAEECVKNWGLEQARIRPQVLQNLSPEQLVTSPEKIVSSLTQVFAQENPPHKVMVLQPFEAHRSFRLQISMNIDGRIMLAMTEKLADEDLEKSFEEECFRHTLLHPFQLNRLQHALKIPFQMSLTFQKLIMNCVFAFMSLDAINFIAHPISFTEAGAFEIHSVQLFIDDHAIFRQSEINLLLNKEQRFSPEKSLISPQGNIVCIASSKDLALATADLITKDKGTVVCAIDIGEDLHKITDHCKQYLETTSVKVIIVNIFTGTLDASNVAKRLMPILEQFGKRFFFVIRLDGTNCMTACKLFSKNYTATPSLKDAVLSAVTHQKQEVSCQ
jgi:succinyl-CoA synthetase beta subunit